MTVDLGATLRGTLLRPGDAGYDAARHLWNGRFDPHPDTVVRCADALDVASAVQLARTRGLRLSVRGGGHSYAGRSVSDGGLLVDLSAMTRIKVDLDAGTAEVGPGVLWRDLDAATQAHGLATTGVTVSSVGVVGSALGGGTGWLSPSFGHTVDNVLAAEVVTADGQVLEVDEERHPGLFWAVRGAGPQVGVVTSVTLALHELGPEVLAGQIIYPFDDAETLLRRTREVLASAPDGFQCLPFTFRVPPIDAFPEELHGQPVLDLVVFHADPGAVDVVQPLRELGPTILDTVGGCPYTTAQTAFDPNLPAGARYYSRAHDLADLTDGAIDTFCAGVRTMVGPLTVAYLEPKGGAAGRVPPEATAMGGRDAAYSFHIIAGWLEPDDDAEVMAWTRDFADAMSQWGTGGVYVNLLAEDEEHRVPTAFSDPDRVRAASHEWDPTGMFGATQGVAPDIDAGAES